MSGLNHGQFTQLNVAVAVALRTTFLIEALVHLAYSDEATARELEPVRDKLEAYRAAVDELVNRFELTGDPHDVRPIAIDQAFRLRDALSPSLVEALTNFGPLDPPDEATLRQQLAELSLLVDEIARAIYRLPPKSC